MQTITCKLPLSGAIGILALAFAQLSFGSTPPAIQIADGAGNTVLIDFTGAVTFGGSCTPATCSTAFVSVAAGDFFWLGQLGAFNFGHVAAVSKPVSPTPTMDVDFAVSTLTGGTITIMWGDTNFNVPGVSSFTTTVFGNATASSGTFTTYVDNSNALFGHGTTVGTLGPFSTAPFSGNVTEPDSPATPFSMTEMATITMGANASFNVDFSLAGSGGTPPPPTSCTLGSFTGTYQFNAAGTAYGISSVLVGTLVADGAGHFTTTESSYAFGIPGTLLPVPPPAGILNFTDINQGTYQVNSDCTMTLVFHPSIDENPPVVYFPIHWDAFLVKGQMGFYFIATDQGELFSGAGKKI